MACRGRRCSRLAHLPSGPASPTHILASWGVTTGETEAGWWQLRPQSHPPVHPPVPRGPSPASTNLSARGPGKPPRQPAPSRPLPPRLGFFLFPFRRQSLTGIYCAPAVCKCFVLSKYPLLCEVRVHTSCPWVKNVPGSFGSTPEAASRRSVPAARTNPRPEALGPCTTHVPPWPECACVGGGPGTI